jgi:predicted phosphodiesterase
VCVQFVGLGHSHVTFVSEEARGTVISPGSVGQPKHGDRRESYAVVSAVEGAVKIANFRIEYDYEAAASKIRAAGLREQLADRLRSGT